MFPRPTLVDTVAWLALVPALAGAGKFLWDAYSRRRSRGNPDSSQVILDRMPVGVAWTNAAGTVFQGFNRRMVEMLGYSPEELRRKSPLDITHPADRGKTLELIHSLEATRAPRGMAMEKRYVRANGETLWVKLHLSRIREETEGQAACNLAIIEDVSERKIAEAEARTNRENFYNLLENIHLGIVMIDREKRILLGNAVFCRWFPGVDMETLPKCLEVMLPDRETPCLDRPREGALGAMTPRDFQAKIRCQGEIKDFLIWSSARRNEAGEIDGSLYVMEDITDKRRSEETLQQTDSLLRKVAETTTKLLLNRDTRTAIDQALREMGDALASDRVFVFINELDPETGELLARHSFEYVRGDVPPLLHEKELHGVPYAPRYARWKAELSETRPIMGTIRTFPVTEKNLLEKYGVKSIIITPIFVEEKFWGFIGFDDCRTEREWTKQEIDVIMTLGNAIGGAFERNRRLTEIREAKEAAEVAERVKAAFLSNMSHELRTPLNGILGLSELLIETAEDEECRDYLNIIRGSSEQLLNVISDILEYSRVESGAQPSRICVFDLHERVENACGVFLAPAMGKGLWLHRAIAPNVPRLVEGDAYHLTQTLLALIGNAVKFTNAGGGRVVVEKTGQSGHQVEIKFSVTDTGIGVSAEARQRVFQAFSQADNSYTRPYTGVGLGLTIASGLVKAMGGKLELESEEGVGSTFYFTVPFQLPTRAVAVAALEE